MPTRCHALWIALACVVFAGCQTTGGSNGGGASSSELISARTSPVTILNQFHGDDPALTAPSAFLVNSQAQLEAMGAKELAKLAVNYDTNSLLVLALGKQSTAGYWAHIQAVQKRGASLFLQGQANRPAADAASAQVETYPFAAVLLPKISNGLVIPEIESVTGQPLPAEAAQTQPK